MHMLQVRATLKKGCHCHILPLGRFMRALMRIMQYACTSDPSKVNFGNEFIDPCISRRTGDCTCTAATPTPPAAPSTSTVCPAWSRARSTSARCAVPKATGSPAAASKSTFWGSLKTPPPLMTTSSAKAPPSVTAHTFTFNMTALHFKMVCAFSLARVLLQ